jgi:hypothetical protein
VTHTNRRLTFESPYGCRWCGDEQYHHGQQWAPIIGMHHWLEPSQEMILERMLRRLDARLNAPKPAYHATTRYTGTPGDPDDEGDALCADCGTDACPQYQRIQHRRALHLTDPAGQTNGGGWGGNPSRPF